jgi:hypothetical protein
VFETAEPRVQVRTLPSQLFDSKISDSKWPVLRLDVSGAVASQPLGRGGVGMIVDSLGPTSSGNVGSQPDGHAVVVEQPTELLTRCEYPRFDLVQDEMGDETPVVEVLRQCLLYVHNPFDRGTVRSAGHSGSLSGKSVVVEECGEDVET